MTATRLYTRVYLARSKVRREKIETIEDLSKIEIVNFASTQVKLE
ncbi:MAG: hypothetical protein ACTSWA_12385 [Candidatus Thorarchaeota archaeon]